MVVITEIEDRCIRKPFLGGYRNTATGTEFLNAVTQTGPRRVERKNARTREVQCVQIADAFCQSIRNQATQTLRKDLYLSNCKSVYLTAQPYESYEDMAKRLNLDGHARAIQRSYRAYRLLKYIKSCAQEYRNKVENCKNLENERLEALRKRHRNEIKRQAFPRSRDDFDKLFSLIDRWRLSRLDFAKKNFFRGSQRAENCGIVDKTTEMLKSLEKHRKCLLEEYHEKKRIKFLTNHCKPIRWNGYKALRVEMITLRIQKAREYKSIYEKLMHEDTNFDDRIQLLSSLQKSLSDHDCIVVQKLRRLLEQEMTLLSNRVDGRWLNNLRARVAVAFLNFLSEVGRCTCVDEAEKESNFDNKVMALPASTRKLLCKSCMKMLPYNHFSAHVRMKRLSCCLSCSWLRQQNIDKSEYGPYTYLLNGIRADEQRRNCYSSLLYVIREPGIYHLVNNIWHGHSIVSENDDIFNLRLVRFNIDEEWSPWNCILLTGEEAETHYYIKDFDSFYSKSLLQKIYLAHQIAKTHFTELISFEKKFRESSRYYVIQDREEYEPPKFQE